MRSLTRAAIDWLESQTRLTDDEPTIEDILAEYMPDQPNKDGYIPWEHQATATIIPFPTTRR